MSDNKRSAPEDLGGAPNGMRDPRSVPEDGDYLSPEERRALMRELREYDTIQERDDD